MTNQIQDLAGNTVVVGDRVAGAFRTSNRAYLRLGTVLGFGERGNKLTVRVAWDTESGPNGGEVVNVLGGIEADLFRFVKIGS